MIDINIVNKSFKNKKVLNNLSFRVIKNSFVTIFGASGLGKSTLISILGLLDSSFNGEYNLCGVKIDHTSKDEMARYRNELIGFVFQESHLMMHATVLENLSLPFLYSKEKNFNYDKIYNLCKKFDVHTLLNQVTYTLSGGERQRVAIVRALVLDPKIIIADEPTGNLDDINTEIILKDFKKLSEEGKVVIVVTHDKLTLKYSDKSYELLGGQLNEKTIL